jgi:acetyl esterase/lipase
MKSHLGRHKSDDDKLPPRTILYIHGGAYFMGSFGCEKFIERIARKLNCGILAGNYRLAPQFPFPCGLMDTLAMYLYLVRGCGVPPSEVLVMGASAGGGMVLSLLCLLRDLGIEMPAGATLISPWVDLLHSFPSVVGDPTGDYLPPYGFHHKPSEAWPPPQTNQHPSNEQYITTVIIDGKEVTIRDQIQMIAPNRLLDHPLISPVTQASLGGLCPLHIVPCSFYNKRLTSG